MKLQAKTTLAFSADPHTLGPPAESWFGSAIDTLETIRRVEVEGVLEATMPTVAFGASGIATTISVVIKHGYQEIFDSALRVGARERVLQSLSRRDIVVIVNQLIFVYMIYSTCAPPAAMRKALVKIERAPATGSG